MTHTFTTIRFAELESEIGLEEIDDPTGFQGWLKDPAELTPEDAKFLHDLIRRHRLHLDAYNEEEVKMKLVAPILNRIDFDSTQAKTWYERPLSGKLGGINVTGKVDLMIAAGTKEPVKPYFFLQEYKPETTNRSPEVQLVAQMCVALLQSEATEMRGSYVVGGIWKFVLLNQVESRLTYRVSRALDLIHPSTAAIIYNGLQNLHQQLTSENNFSHNEIVSVKKKG